MNMVENSTSIAPVNLLQIAVEKGASVEQLSQLLDLAERQDKEHARKAFYAARSEFQSICPTIPKDQKVAYGNTKYSFASLNGIAETVRPALSKCGLSYRFEFDEPMGLLRVTCVVTHIDGHSESNAMTGSPDDSGSKNGIQQRGSTATYLQRYTLIGALGITSAAEDDDGKGAGATNVEKLIEHVKVARENFDSVAAIKEAIALDDLHRAIEARDELSDKIVIALHLAPTKGGIFTTEELRVMKSDEWARLRREIHGTPIEIKD